MNIYNFMYQMYINKKISKIKIKEDIYQIYMKGYAAGYMQKNVDLNIIIQKEANKILRNLELL